MRDTRHLSSIKAKSGAELTDGNGALPGGNSASSANEHGMNPSETGVGVGVGVGTTIDLHPDEA